MERHGRSLPLRPGCRSEDTTIPIRDFLRLSRPPASEILERKDEADTGMGASGYARSVLAARGILVLEFVNTMTYADAIFYAGGGVLADATSIGIDRNECPPN